MAGWGGRCYGREIFKLGPSGPELLWDMTSGCPVDNEPYDTLVSGFASLGGLLYFGAAVEVPWPGVPTPPPTSYNHLLYSYDPATPAIAPVARSTHPNCDCIAPWTSAFSPGGAVTVDVDGVNTLYAHKGV